MQHVRVTDWALPAFLALACLVPVAAGLWRGGVLLAAWDWALRFAPDRPDNLPLFLHALASVAFLVLGAAQIVAGPVARWHRCAGRLAFAAGVLGAASGIWMVLAHPAISGPLLHYGRLVFAGFWALSLTLALAAILARNPACHRAWMIRAYAVALNAGTLALVYLPILALWGEPSAPMAEAMQVGGWILNLSLAEWLIRRSPRSHVRPARAMAAG